MQDDHRRIGRRSLLAAGLAAAGPWSPAIAADAPAMVRLDSPGATLLLLRHPQGLPEIAYWGARLPDAVGDDAVRDFLAAGDDLPEATLMPAVGAALFIAPALVAHRAGLDWTAQFDVADIRSAAAGCVVVARDAIAGLVLELHLALDDDNVLSARSVLVNAGAGGLSVERLASGVFLLPAAVAELRVFEGHPAHEFQERTVSLAREKLVVETRGNRSQSHFPGLLAALPDAGQDAGLAYGVQLGWSGGQRLTAERVGDGRVLLVAGELLFPGEVILAAGERLETSTAYATVSTEGLGGVSRQFHAHVRRHVLRWPDGRMRPRPVTLNTWEGNGFDLHEDRLAQQAEAAARLGVERFVLDDGWFRGRRDDTAGLGDWTPDPAVFPHGLGPLARRVNALGMEFGLWFEPEMVDPDSDLYRAHPDWVLGVRGRPLVTGRHQLVLDLTRPEVADYLFAAMTAQLQDAPIAYVKWDMNRGLIDAGDALGHPAYRRQVLAVYALMERLRAASPALEIESCASGGGRADLGVMRYALRVWPSDCTDAHERLQIQRGFLRFLPPEVMAAHVSRNPNQETGRSPTLAFRAAVALFGHLGVELDPLALRPEEAAELAEWIALHKRLRGLLHAGLQFDLPDEDGRQVHGVVAADRSEALFRVAQTGMMSAPGAVPLRLPGLDDGRIYRVTLPKPQAMPAFPRTLAADRLAGDGLLLSGAMLHAAGLLLPPQKPDSALVLHARLASLP